MVSFDSPLLFGTHRNLTSASTCASPSSLSFGFPSCSLALSSLFLLCFFFLDSATVLWGISASQSLSQFVSVSPLLFLYFSVFHYYFIHRHHIPERVQHGWLALTIKIVALNSPRLPNNAVACIQMNTEYASEEMGSWSGAPLMALWMSTACTNPPGVYRGQSLKCREVRTAISHRDV